VRRGDFIAPKFQTDVTRSPIPRFDLLNFKGYMFIGVQFSRGCPAAGRDRNSWRKAFRGKLR